MENPKWHGENAGSMELATFGAGMSGRFANDAPVLETPDRVRKVFPWTVECGVAFTLRDAEVDDLETLWRIDQKCFADGIAYSKPELRFFMRRRGSFTLVGIDEGSREITGFIVAHGGAVGHIITIDVIAAARRAGLGSQLLLAAEERLRLAGSRAVSLESAVDNLSALKFYERHGYTVGETRPGYYSDGVDALVLNKKLGSPRKAAQK